MWQTGMKNRSVVGISKAVTRGNWQYSTVVREQTVVAIFQLLLSVSRVSYVTDRKRDYGDRIGSDWNWIGLDWIERVQAAGGDLRLCMYLICVVCM